MKTTNYPSIIALTMCLGAFSILPFVTGCAGDRYHQSTGESIDDHTTSVAVRDALSDDTQYKYSDVKVMTFKGTVQLSGFVDTRAQKSHADDIAKGVNGVKEVDNNITVKD